MSLTDAFRSKRSRPADGADPARAFGAEELTMEEIQRQTFVPPEKKGPGLAQRAGAALNNLRSRIVGEEPAEEFWGDYREPEQPPMEEAPVYSARNYQSESAPDLGWENPFTDPTPKAAASTATAPRPRRAYRAAGQESYAPAFEEPMAEPAYQQPSYQQPVYEPVYPQREYPQSYQPQESYAADADFYGSDPRYAPQPESWERDPYGYDYPEQSFPEEAYYPRDDGAWYGRDNMPRARRSRPKTEVGDFKYLFWSGGIVLSMFLTLVAFIYGCTI